MKMNEKVKIIALALVINTVVFFFLPYLKHLQDKKLAELLGDKPENALAKSFKITPPEVKKKKIKVQKRKVENDKQLNNDRFKLDLSLNTGSGIGIGSASDENVVYQEGDVDTLPQKIRANDPEIPNLFARSSLKGNVEVLVVINEQGRVVKISPLKEEPKGYELLKSVTSAVWGWRFKPATLKNIPVKVEVIIPFVF